MCMDRGKKKEREGDEIRSFEIERKYVWRDINI